MCGNHLRSLTFALPCHPKARFREGSGREFTSVPGRDIYSPDGHGCVERGGEGQGKKGAVHHRTGVGLF